MAQNRKSPEAREQARQYRIAERERATARHGARAAKSVMLTAAAFSVDLFDAASSFETPAMADALARLEAAYA